MKWSLLRFLNGMVFGLVSGYFFLHSNPWYILPAFILFFWLWLWLSRCEEKSN